MSFEEVASLRLRSSARAGYGAAVLSRAGLIAFAYMVFILSSEPLVRASEACRDVHRLIETEATKTLETRATIALARRISPSVLPTLLARTKNADPEVAFSAFIAIGFSRHADALKQLRDASRPPNDVARLGRALGLFALGDGSHTGTITRALYQGTLTDRRRTAEILSRMPQKRPQIMLYDSLEDGDETVRYLAAKQLIRVGSGRARRVLTDIVRTGSLAMKPKAAKVLLRVGYSFRPDELAALSTAQKLEVMIKKGNWRALSSNLKVQDPTARAVAFAALALAGVDSPAQLKKLEKSIAPKGLADASGEAVAALLLLGETAALPFLDQFDKEKAERTIAVLFAYSRGGPSRAPLATEHAGQLARTLEGWIGRGLVKDEDAALAIRAVNRLDPIAGLLIARGRLMAHEPKALRAAIRVIGRSGSLGDVPQLLDVTRHGGQTLRMPALRAADRVCGR